MNAQTTQPLPAYPVPLIERDGAFIVIYDLHEDGRKVERYDIPVSGLQHAEGVDSWMRQLASKTWITPLHLDLLSRAIHSLREDG